MSVNPDWLSAIAGTFEGSFFVPIKSAEGTHFEKVELQFRGGVIKVISSSNPGSSFVGCNLAVYALLESDTNSSNQILRNLKRRLARCFRFEIATYFRSDWDRLLPNLAELKPRHLMSHLKENGLFRLVIEDSQEYAFVSRMMGVDGRNRLTLVMATAGHPLVEVAWAQPTLVLDTDSIPNSPHNPFSRYLFNRLIFRQSQKT